MTGLSAASRGGVIGLHAVGLVVLAVLAWIVRLPQTGGDIAFFAPGLATWFAIPGLLVVLGLMSWWLWGATRLLVAADVVAIVPILFLAIAYGVLGIGIGAFIVVPILLGATSAWGLRKRATGLGDRRRVRLITLLALLIPVVLSWWYALTSAFGFPSVGDYGLVYVATGGTIAAAIILWLDRRPALLLGASAWLLWIAVPGLALGLGGYPEAIVFATLLLVGGVSGVLVSARDAIGVRGGRLVTIVALAAGTFIALEYQPILSPLLAIVALLVDRPDRSMFIGFAAHPEAASEVGVQGR